MGEMKIKQLLLLLLIIQALGNISKAAHPDIWNIPAPHVVFSIERIPNCKGCPSYEMKLYSDGTVHFEGKEGVFGLGEFGGFKYWEPFRTADPASEAHPGEAKSKREHYLKYRRIHPDGGFNQLMNRVLVDSGFLDFQRESRGATASSSARSRFRIEANWVNRKQSIVIADDQVPAHVQQMMDTFFKNYFGDFYTQPVPPFWSDDDALLRVTEIGGHWRCESQTGLILYKSGKAVMFGWNKLTRDNQFQTIAAPVEISVLQTIFSGFDRGRSDPKAKFYNQAQRIVEAKNWSIDVDQTLHIGNLEHVLIYKPNPNKLMDVPTCTVL